MRYSCLWIGGLWLLSACIERIPLDESLTGEPLLVVDGGVSNQAGPYRVALSYTSSTLEAYQGEALTGAEVYLTDQENNRTEFTETIEDPGIYVTDSSTFRGNVGSTYQLHVVAPNGKTYASIPETIPPVSAIDSIYFSVENRPRVDLIGNLTDEWGLRFYVETADGSDQTVYYRWTWSETFQFPTPIIPPGPPTDVATICYLTAFPPRVIRLGSTQGLQNNRIKQKLNFVTIAGRQLQIRYSLLVQQHALTERAYIYWQSVQQQIESVGGIFDPPPSPLVGNLYNVDNDRETVLGYFQAASVAEKRIFVSRSEVPPSPDGSMPSPSSACSGESPSDFCLDCSLVPGATTVPPPFW